MCTVFCKIPGILPGLMNGKACCINLTEKSRLGHSVAIHGFCASSLLLLRISHLLGFIFMSCFRASLTINALK